MTDRVSLGIDVGGGTVKVVTTGRSGIVDRFVEPRGRPFGPGLAALVERIERGVEIHSIGVGIAGLVDHDAGRFVWGPHVSSGPVDLGSVLDHPALYVDNDANLAAYAEAVDGPASGHHVVLVISVGTGIGAGLVVGGDIQRGAGFAGEVGHMRMSLDGDPCPCGRAGCWETRVSGRVLDAHARRLGLGDDLRALVDAAEQGDDRARRILADAGRWLGIGIANLILTIDPSAVVVAGGVEAAAGEWILGPARDWIASGLPGAGHRPEVPVLRSQHGRWAAATGAALAAATLTEPKRTNEDSP